MSLALTNSAAAGSAVVLASAKMAAVTKIAVCGAAVPDEDATAAAQHTNEKEESHSLAHLKNIIV